jgi:hypothetical protein
MAALGSVPVALYGTQNDKVPLPCSWTEQLQHATSQIPLKRVQSTLIQNACHVGYVAVSERSLVLGQKGRAAGLSHVHNIRQWKPGHSSPERVHSILTSLLCLVNYSGNRVLPYFLPNARTPIDNTRETAGFAYQEEDYFSCTCCNMQKPCDGRKVDCNLLLLPVMKYQLNCLLKWPQRRLMQTNVF